MSKKSEIIKHFDSELSPMGFKRNRATWNRAQGSMVEVIEIQTDKLGENVTINAGVLLRSIYELAWGRIAEEFIEEPFCTVRARIGQLLDDKDLWWDVSNPSAAVEMTVYIYTLIIPFLERMRSTEEIRDWLCLQGIPLKKDSLRSIYLSVLQFQMGNSVEACATLAELEKNALGTWKVRAKEVRSRLGCA